MKTKQTIYILAILLMIALNPLRLHASHAEGMQLTYTHLSGSVYRLSLTWYRDCTTMMVPLTSVPIHVVSSSCGVNQFFSLDIDSSQSKMITLICAYDSAYCIGGNAPAFEKLVYENDITLSGQCPDWLFELSVSGRNAGITTLQNPGGDALYVAAQLNNLNSDNNSPQFTHDPIVFVCINQDFHYNHGMFDADGDSISYQLINPRTDANTPALFNGGYSALNPVSSNPPVTFNDFTGDLLMHPLNMEVAVVAYEIKDWRNGELMGTVMRDIMVYTVPCGTYPIATGMNGTSQQFLYVFPDDTVCFNVLSDDIDANDTVTMTWNQTIPNATFVANGIPHPTGNFCWIPTVNDVRTQPYMFTVMVHDNACALENACIYSYFIYVTLDSSLVWAGTNHIDIGDDLSIFPNPSAGVFEINPGEKISQVSVFDSFGKCILKSRTGRIDLSDMREGMYVAEVLMLDGKKHYHKIVRQ